MITDISELEKFSLFIAEAYEKARNKKYLSRVIKDERYITVNDSDLDIRYDKFAGWQLSPKQKFIKKHIEHYFIKIFDHYKMTFGLYYKKTFYQKQSGTELKSTLNFSLINCISSFLLGNWNIKMGIKLPINSGKAILRYINNQWFYTYSSKDTQSETYLFNIKWRNQCIKFYSPTGIFNRAQSIYYKPQLKKRLENVVYHYNKNPELFSERLRNIELDDEHIWPHILFCDFLHPIIGQMDTRVLDYMIFDEIPFLGNLWIDLIFDENRKIKDQSLKKLNSIIHSLSIIGDTNALNLFLYLLALETAYSFEDRAVLRQCEYCDLFFRFKPNKKYCSKLDDGRNCSKKATNRKYYSRHQKKLKKYYRNEMRYTRELVKLISDKETQT